MTCSGRSSWWYGEAEPECVLPEHEGEVHYDEILGWFVEHGGAAETVPPEVADLAIEWARGKAPVPTTQPVRLTIYRAGLGMPLKVSMVAPGRSLIEHIPETEYAVQVDTA